MFTAIALSLALQGGKVEHNQYGITHVTVNATKGDAKKGTMPKPGMTINAPTKQSKPTGKKR